MNITRKELRELEHAVIKYLGSNHGGKHYRTFELMYALIEKYKFKRSMLNKITEEIHKLTV